MKAKAQKTVFANCTLVDVKADCALVKGVDIFVEEGRIADIKPAGGDRTGWKVYDATGKFVMPGLVNAHAHLFGTGLPSKVISGGGAQKLVLKLVHSPLGMAVLKMLVASACAQELNSGVTTLRGLGDFRFSDVAVRDALKKVKARRRDSISSCPDLPSPHPADTETGLLPSPHPHPRSSRRLRRTMRATAPTSSRYASRAA